MKEPGFYIIEYSHNNITWSINVWADSYKDAKKKLKSIKKGEVKGKLADSISAGENFEYQPPPEDRPSLKVLKADI